MKYGELLNISIKSSLNRKWTLSLIIFSIAISTILLLGIEKIETETRNNFLSSISGTDLIVGARGSPTQLVLYSIFHLGRATNNIESIDYITKNEDVEWVIPISLGDSYKRLSVVGTENDFFKYYKFGGELNIKFKEGREFESDFDVVVGSQAKEKLNDEIKVSHGNSSQEHKEIFKVVGILEPTGTPIDNSIFITLNAMDTIHSGYIPQKRAITSMLVGLKERRKVFTIQKQFNNYKKEALTAILPGVAIDELWRMLNIGEKAITFISMLVMFSSMFGLSASILAGLNERKQEIAILRSIGATPFDISILLAFEGMFIMLCGIVIGVFLLYLLLWAMIPIILSKYSIRIALNFLTANEILLIIKIYIIGFIITLIPVVKGYIMSLKSSLK
ncbi:MAG: ABC transporter permease [Rickettsiales bacterium]|nr:MAG: ABC transporter permease [Rickettsiales bacterium]